jgi:hypothetical protein
MLIVHLLSWPPARMTMDAKAGYGGTKRRREPNSKKLGTTHFHPHFAARSSARFANPDTDADCTLKKHDNLHRHLTARRWRIAST